MVKETEKFDLERRVRSTGFAHFWSVPEGDIGCLLALAGRYNALTGFCHKPYEITMEPQSRAPHLLHAGHVIHSHKHNIELVNHSTSTGVGDGLGGLACCDSWGHKELDTTEQLN